MVLFMLSESKKRATTWEDITKKHEIVQCVKVFCCCYSLTFMKIKRRKLWFLLIFCCLCNLYSSDSESKQTSAIKE
ncbi:LOW QUALITY PROTEIN: uncharacterized protein LOC125609057 [Brassica napus]|uniref:LOW QUALITY PROTEIN: uncharacterized protein LOC125609057 n=1 Tax=Brassica napus TaxID=3708 RepID=UPI00207902C3|nr:LOW QUALITY PROTEIN: uncharacterized protein LOC125609057 [Brassica napus]